MSKYVNIIFYNSADVVSNGAQFCDGATDTASGRSCDESEIESKHEKEKHDCPNLNEKSNAAEGDAIKILPCIEGIHNVNLFNCGFRNRILMSFSHFIRWTIVHCF